MTVLDLAVPWGHWYVNAFYPLFTAGFLTPIIIWTATGQHRGA